MSGFSDCTIVSNQLTAPNVNAQYSNALAAKYRISNNQFSEATVIALDSQAQLRLFLRSVSGQAPYYRLQVVAGGVTVHLIDSATDTQLADIPGTISANDVIKFSVTETTLSVYKNGSLLTSVNDPVCSQGSPGVGIYVQNVGHVGIWGNWQGGDSITVRHGVFSKDRACYSWLDQGLVENYGLFDDDWVTVADGTTIGATATGITSAACGLFSKDATLDGVFDS